MKYLIPVDSSGAWRAPVERLARAARRRENVEAVVVNVQPLFNRHISQFTRKADRDALRAERSQAAMAEASAQLARAGIPHRLIAEAGDPAERIAAIAAAEQVDAVLPGDGRPGLFERYALPAGVAGLTALLLAGE